MSTQTNSYQVIITPTDDPFEMLATAYMPLCPHETDIRAARAMTVEYAASLGACSDNDLCFPPAYASVYRFYLCMYDRQRGQHEGRGV